MPSIAIKDILNCNNISHYYSFSFIFDQINTTLVSRRLKKNLTNPKLVNGGV